MNPVEHKKRVVQRLKELDISKGYAVDLDDTCFDTTTAYHDEISTHYPLPSKITKEALRKTYALTGKLAYWQDIPEAMSIAYGLMGDQEFNGSIKPIPGAANALTRLHHKGIVTCYKTARQEKFRSITLESLSKHGFPDMPLMMREDDCTFEHHIDSKAASLNAAFPIITGIIDNDSRLARKAEYAKYQGEFFLFGLTTSDFKPLNCRIHPIKTWLDTEAKVRERYASQQ
jgi:hypothetical protein